MQKESYVILCMCRLTLVWTLAKLPQSYWNADSSWSFTGLDPLSCRLVSLLSRVDSFSPSSLANCPLLGPFVSSLLASPYHFRSRRDLKSKTLCLVSRQNRQKNRLLGGPPTQCFRGIFGAFSFHNTFLKLIRTSELIGPSANQCTIIYVYKST